jgi:DNA-binding SARP family transcriptional activator/tetratricopeptide (TPR) repeat protein
MEFGLLGPLVVCHDGVALPVTRGKQRTVLAALLLDANRVVRVDDLMDVLWPAGAPPSAKVTMQNYVKRLRHALRDGDRDRISTHPRGYRIEVDDGELDLTRFEDLVTAARGCARTGSWDTVAARAAEALALWRGEPLNDVGSELLRAREAARLTELRLQALETRLDAELRLGGHVEVLPELRQLVTAHPLREQPRALLMIALYRCGRQAEALAAYQDARDALVGETGTEPGALLRDLHQRLLAADPDLELPGTVPPAAVPARQVRVPHELPASATHFTGREQELATLTGRVTEQAPGSVPVMVISGSPGVGKTALALRWAHEVAGRFPDGQLYLNLRGYDPDQPVTATDALARFLRALGVPGAEIPAEADERAACYRSLLAERRVLVVLDNAGQADQVRPLLPATAGCRVLVTSRDSLAGLVAKDGAQRLDLDLLPLPDAITLLSTLIGDRVDEDPAAASTLAVHCARLPLALRVAAEIAVAHPGVSLAALAGRLADRQQRLDQLDVSSDQHTMVRTVFSWSYRELAAPAARGFRLAGVHPGADFDGHAFAALTGSTAEQAATVLDRLSRAHLIQPASPGRYGLHDLLRAYASELAAAEEDAVQAALTRLFDYYLGTAAAAMDRLYPAERHRRPEIQQLTVPPRPLPDSGAARAWLDAERACLTAIAEYAGQHGWPGHTTSIATTLVSYLDLGGHFADARAIHSQARAAARRTGDHGSEAVALCSLGIVELRQGRYQQASGHFHRALTLFGDVGDDNGRARAHNNLGLIDGHQGRHDRAFDHIERALDLHRQAHDRFGEARALSNLGICAGHLGRLEASADFHQRALVLCGQLGDHTGEGLSLSALGEIHLLQGRPDAAVGNYRRALVLFGEIGNRHGEIVARNGLGAAYLAGQRPAEARDEYAAALGLAAANGEVYERARAHDGLARSLQAAAEPGPARQHWQQALTLFGTLGAPEAEQIRALLYQSAEAGEAGRR